MRPKTTTDNSWTPTWFIMALLHPSQANCLCYRSSTTWSTSLGQLNSVSDKHIPVSSHTCVGQICFWQASNFTLLSTTRGATPHHFCSSSSCETLLFHQLSLEKHLIIFSPHHVGYHSTHMVVNHFTLPLTFIEQHLFIFAPHHHHRHVSYHPTNMVVIHSLISPTSGRVRRPTWGIKLHPHHHQPLHSPSHSDFINLYFDVHRPFCLHLHGHVFSTMLGFRLHSSISTARAGAHGSPSLPHHALVHRWDRTRHRLHFFAYARVLRSSPSSFRTLAIHFHPRTIIYPF